MSEQRHCWLCDGELPDSFATVIKGGLPRRVHVGCAREAISVVIEDHGDFDDRRRHALDYDLEPGPIG